MFIERKRGMLELSSLSFNLSSRSKRKVRLELLQKLSTYSDWFDVVKDEHRPVGKVLWSRYQSIKQLWGDIQQERKPT